MITVLDAAYPMNLRMVHDRPPALFVRGELNATDERSVAVVGSRKASPEVSEKAAEIARDLVSRDYVVVSGLAAGIDTAAHQAALEAGGRTVAGSAPASGTTSQSRTRSCKSDLAVRAPSSRSSGLARKHVVGRSPSATL